MASPFPADIIRAAEAAKAKFAVRIPVAITLAQWAIESGFGKHLPAGSFNPFGIKARPGEPFVVATTHEFIHNHDTVVQAKFRKFSSYREAFEAHAKLLATGSPYAEARQRLPDADAFARALTGVYATDPNYGVILINMMKKYDLYAYDEETDPNAPTDAGAMSLKDIQSALHLLGYEPGPIDGLYGGRTAAAIKAFEAEHTLPPDGKPDLGFVVSLKAALDEAGMKREVSS